MADVIPEDDELDEEIDEDFSEDDEFDDVDAEDLDPVDDVVDVEVDVVEVEKEEEPDPRPAHKKRHSGDEEDEDEELDDDDVEEDLGEILQARLAAADTGEEEDDEDEGSVALDVEDRTNKANRVQPKRPEEFVCQSCFLVKHPSQLADPDHMLCADCV
jgi:hypothetical protein